MVAHNPTIPHVVPGVAIKGCYHVAIGTVAFEEGACYIQDTVADKYRLDKVLRAPTGYMFPIGSVVPNEAHVTTANGVVEATGYVGETLVVDTVPRSSKGQVVLH